MTSVSIIVPVYNAEKYLRQAIDSVKTQTFQDWELILVDDGSTDSSNAICHEYADADKRIRLIEKENGGLSSARNAALDIAEGEYIFFLDADDELYDYSITHLFKIARETSADIIIGKPISSALKPVAKCPSIEKAEIKDSKNICHDILYQKASTDNGAWSKLYRSNLFSNLRFYKGWFEDLEIFHKLLYRANKIAVTDAVVYFYRNHPESFINSWSESRKDIVNVTAGIVNQMKTEHPGLIKAAEHRYFSASYNLLVALVRNNPTDTESISKSFETIKSLRKQIIFDSNSRLKNRVGALASYFGLKFLSTAIRWATK